MNLTDKLEYYQKANSLKMVKNSRHVIASSKSKSAVMDSKYAKRSKDWSDLYMIPSDGSIII